MNKQAPKNPSRQVRRESARRAEFALVRQEFGGYTDRGGPYWPVNMPRAIARSIAFDRAKRNRATEKEQANG